MKKILLIFVLITVCISCEFTDESMPQDTDVSPKQSDFYLELAFQHAPVHYQDVDRTGSHGLGGKADFITPYDFDGDLNATNNWDNLANANYPTNAIGYYSVVETTTHYFITYAFFHARDWTDIWFLYHWDEHENDLEGILTVIKKDGTTFGKSIAAITVFHSDFYSFIAPDSNLASGNETIDGTITLQNDNGIDRFMTAAEPKGHGMKAYSKLKPGGSDWIVYYPSKTLSESPLDIYDRNVTYKLVNIFENDGMWEQRFNTDMFLNQTAFQKSYGSGRANAIWNWDDKDDGNNPGARRGDFAYYPADLVDEYFDGLGTFSKDYIYNPYLGIE